MEEGVCKSQVIFCTESKEKESVGIAVSNPMFAEIALPEMVIVTNSGVEVTKDEQFIVLRNGSDDSIERVIEGIFNFVIWV